jgi:hypothetical protein
MTNPNLIEEKDLDLSGLEQVHRAPIGTPAPPMSAPQNSQTSGIISSSTFGLNTDIADSALPGNAPSYRIMPLGPSGQGQNNSSNDSSLLKNPSFLTTQALAEENANAIAAAGLTGWQGSWIDSVNYSLGAIVDYSGVIYVSLQNQNLNEEPDTSAAFWQATGQVQFFGAFDISTTYGIGAIVDEGGILYISIQAGNVGNTPPNATWWTPLGSASFAGTWSSATSYTTGQTVIGSNGSLYVALQDSTNENPVSTTGYWQLLSGSVTLFGNWNNSTAYPIGAEVFYGNSVWIATTSNTNQVPAVGSSYWELVSNLATATGFQMVSNPDFQNGLTNYNVYDNNSTGHITLSLASNFAAPGGFGQTLEISIAAGGESPGLGGFYYSTALDSGVVILDHYHVGDTYIVSVWANIPVGYTINFANNTLGTGGSFTPLSSSYAGTGGWVNYIWQVTIGTSPASGLAFPFFYLTGTFSSAFNWYAAQLSITDINQPQRGNQNLLIGAWSSTTQYVPQNEVTYQGSFWQCTTANTNETPTFNSSYWMPVNNSSVLLANWSSSVTYPVGAQAYGSDGNVYQAIAVSLNEAPPNATYWQLVAKVQANTEVFVSSGTWTKPSAGTFAIITVIGGGSSGTAGQNGGAALGGIGGGAGGLSTQILPLSVLGSTETVTVGTGGLAASSHSTANAGGASSFGDWVQAGGGTATSGGGAVIGAGTAYPGAASFYGGNGGNGGTSGANSSASGQSGSGGSAGGTARVIDYGGGSGGAGGSGGGNNPGTGGGVGSSATTDETSGGGGGGGGGAGAGSGAGAIGGAGGSYGAGGGGGGSSFSGAVGNGAAGASGLVTIAVY